MNPLTAGEVYRSGDFFRLTRAYIDAGGGRAGREEVGRQLRAFGRPVSPNTIRAVTDQIANARNAGGAYQRGGQGYQPAASDLPNLRPQIRVADRTIGGINRARSPVVRYVGAVDVTEVDPDGTRRTFSFKVGVVSDSVLSRFEANSVIVQAVQEHFTSFKLARDYDVQVAPVGRILGAYLSYE